MYFGSMLYCGLAMQASWKFLFVFDGICWLIRFVQQLIFFVDPFRPALIVLFRIRHTAHLFGSKMLHSLDGLSLSSIVSSSDSYSDTSPSSQGSTASKSPKNLINSSSFHSILFKKSCTENFPLSSSLVESAIFSSRICSP